VAFFAVKSVSKTPRAFEQAVQTWIGILSSIALARAWERGGHPTGMTASAMGVRMRETASPSKKICTSWPASAKALAWRKGNDACVGSFDPHALLINTFIALPLLVAGGHVMSQNTSSASCSVDLSFKHVLTPARSSSCGGEAVRPYSNPSCLYQLARLEGSTSLSNYGKEA